MHNCVKFNYSHKNVKGLVTKLAPPHAQNVWGSRGERVRTARLATCCNYLSKKIILIKINMDVCH